MVATAAPGGATELYGIDTEPARDLAGLFARWSSQADDLIAGLAAAEARSDLTCGARGLFDQVGSLGRSLAHATITAVEDLEGHRLNLAPGPKAVLGLVDSLTELARTWLDVPTAEDIRDEVEAYRDGTHPDLGEMDPDLDAGQAAQQGLADLIGRLVGDDRVAAGLAGLLLAGVPLDDALMYETGEDFDTLFEELRQAMQAGEPPGSRGLPIGIFPTAYVERYPDPTPVEVNELGASAPAPIADHPDDSPDHPLNWSSWEIVTNIAGHNGAAAELWLGHQLPEFVDGHPDRVAALLETEWVAVGFFNELGAEETAYLPARLTPVDPYAPGKRAAADLVAELVAPFAGALAKASWNGHLEFTGAEMILAADVRLRGTGMAPPEHMLLAEGFEPSFVDSAVLASIDQRPYYVHDYATGGLPADPGRLTMAAAALNQRLVPLIETAIQSDRFQEWVTPVGRSHVGSDWPPEWFFDIPIAHPDLGERVMYYIAERAETFPMDGVGGFVALTLPQVVSNPDLLDPTEIVFGELNRAEGELVVVAMTATVKSEIEAQVESGRVDFDWSHLMPVVAMVNGTWGHGYGELRHQDRITRWIANLWKYGRYAMSLAGIGGAALGVASRLSIFINFDTNRTGRAIEVDLQRIVFEGYDLGEFATELIFESGRVRTAPVDGEKVSAVLDTDRRYVITVGDDPTPIYRGELGTTEATEVIEEFYWVDQAGNHAVQVGTAINSVRTLIDQAHRIFGTGAFDDDDDDDDDDRD